MTRTVLSNCPIKAEIRAVDSQSDLRIFSSYDNNNNNNTVNNNDKNNNNNETLIKRPFPRFKRRYLKFKFKI